MWQSCDVKSCRFRSRASVIAHIEHQNQVEMLSVAGLSISESVEKSLFINFNTMVSGIFTKTSREQRAYVI